MAAWLLPGYFSGEQETAYARLERRFGAGTRRLVSVVFLATRFLGDGVRIFAGAIPLALVTGWSVPTSILAMGVITLVYTWFGGLKAVVWADVVQLAVYLAGGVAALLIAWELAGGPGAALASGETMTVFSGCGEDSETVFYWCASGSAIWNNDGDTVFLTDPSGNTHDSLSYVPTPTVTVAGPGAATVIRPTPACAYRPTRPTSTAEMSPTAGSRSPVPTGTDSTATATVSDASPDLTGVSADLASRP